MTKLLAAVDNSTAALPVVGAAGAIADLLGAKVEVLHVVEDGDDLARAAADSALVPFWRLDGDPVEQLLAAADDADVMGIVVAARNIDGPHAPTVGTTCRGLITQLGKPVVVVPPDMDGPARIDRVLVPLDESRATSEAVGRAVGSLADSDVELVILHVSSPDDVPRFSEQPQHETDTWSDEFLMRYSPADSSRVSLELRFGDPAAEVSATATRVAADLVVLAWRQTFDEGHAAVVERLLRQDRIPVLLVPIGTGIQPATAGAAESAANT
jgi:nucleotide-binding universal stress UspA family protein